MAGDWLSLLDIDIDIDIDIESLPLFDAERFKGSIAAVETGSLNGQNVATWEQEAATIAANQWRITWHQPSRHEELPAHVEQVDNVFVGTEAMLEARPNQGRQCGFKVVGSEA